MNRSVILGRKWNGMHRKTGLLITFILLWAAALLGCGGGDRENRETPETSGPEPTLVRGMYAFGHEVRALQPCGEEEDLWVIDPSGTLQAVHGSLVGNMADAPRVFVVATGVPGPAPAEGFGVGYAGSVTIDEVLYVALEGFRCDFDLTRFTYRASGTEPFWLVEVLPAGLTLTRPGSPAVTWPEVATERKGDLLVFTGSGADRPCRLTIIPEPARDAMSGAYFRHKAVFTLGEDEFTGVAMRGFAEN